MQRVVRHDNIGFTDNDMVGMFEEAFKKLPTNEDLGAQTFFANVRANHWKSAQQVSLERPIYMRVKQGISLT